MKVFNFCPDSQVPETLTRENTSVMSLGGWQFTARPTTPFQRRFKLTLHGLRWFLDERNDAYDEVTDPKLNARLLELFYQEHEMWKPFEWFHPHIPYKPLACRFQSPLNVPAALENSDGLIGALEVNFVEHNAGF